MPTRLPSFSASTSTSCGAQRPMSIKSVRTCGRSECEYRALHRIARRDRSHLVFLEQSKRSTVNILGRHEWAEFLDDLRENVCAHGRRSAGMRERALQLDRIKWLLLAVGLCYKNMRHALFVLNDGYHGKAERLFVERADELHSGGWREDHRA